MTTPHSTTQRRFTINMSSNRKETAFEIAERINRAIDDMARIAVSHQIPITNHQARLVYARCVQSNDRKWIGHQHYTINTDKTIENLRILAPPYLVQQTQRTVKDGMELLYKTDTDSGYSVNPHADSQPAPPRLHRVPEPYRTAAGVQPGYLATKTTTPQPTAATPRLPVP